MAAPAPANPYYVPANVQEAAALRAARRAARAQFKEVFRTRAREEITSARARTGRRLTPYGNAATRRARALENIERRKFEAGRNRNFEIGRVRNWARRTSNVTEMTNRGLYKKYRTFFISELNRIMSRNANVRAGNRWSRTARAKEGLARLGMRFTAARSRAGAKAAYGGRMAVRGLSYVPRGAAYAGYSAALLPGVQGGRAKFSALGREIGEYQTESGRRGTLITLRRELNNANANVRAQKNAVNVANRAATVAQRARNNANADANRPNANNAVRQAADRARRAANNANAAHREARNLLTHRTLVRGQLQTLYDVLNRGGALTPAQRGQLTRLLGGGAPAAPNAAARRARRNALFNEAGVAPPRAWHGGRPGGYRNATVQRARAAAEAVRGFFRRRRP